MAYASARWTEKHLTELFAGADAVPSTLFLWHLAEEVEHKLVAFDVYRAVGGSRRTYALAMVVSMLLFAWFSVVGTVTMLFANRRLFSPLAHVRLVRWPFLTSWLRQFDPVTGTMPEWSLGFLAA